MTIQSFHMKEPFKRMKARPATKALINPPANVDDLPFDINEFIDTYKVFPYDGTGGSDQ